MFYVYTQTDASPAGRQGAARGGLMARLFGWLTWALMAAMGLMFLFVLLFWLAVMAAVSLVAGLVTGRPSTVGTLWKQYRAMARQRWPQPPGQQRSETPRADAAGGRGAPGETHVQDVHWREVPDDDSPESR